MDIDLKTLSRLIGKPFLCEIDGKRVLVDPNTCAEDLVPKYGYRIAEVQYEEGMALLTLGKNASDPPRFEPNNAWVKEQFPDGDPTFF